MLSRGRKFFSFGTLERARSVKQLYWLVANLLKVRTGPCHFFRSTSRPSGVGGRSQKRDRESSRLVGHPYMCARNSTRRGMSGLTRNSCFYLSYSSWAPLLLVLASYPSLSLTRRRPALIPNLCVSVPSWIEDWHWIRLRSEKAFGIGTDVVRPRLYDPSGRGRSPDVTPSIQRLERLQWRGRSQTRLEMTGYLLLYYTVS